MRSFYDITGIWKHSHTNSDYDGSNIDGKRAWETVEWMVCHSCYKHLTCNIPISESERKESVNHLAHDVALIGWMAEMGEVVVGIVVLTVWVGNGCKSWEREVGVGWGTMGECFLVC